MSGKILGNKKGRFHDWKRPFISRNLVDQFVHIRALRRVVRRAGRHRSTVLEGGSQIGVDLGVFGILARVFHDGSDGAGGITAGALSALLGIDDHEGLTLIFPGMNAIHGTDIDALRVNFT
jgi:hypothetical protein